MSKQPYSVAESPRDRAGLTDDAAALDVGMFKVRTPKGTFDLRHYSRWMVAQCEAGTADTQHIREVIYSPDGQTVRRWDRLGRRSSGDNSHLTHTHESYFRDAIKAGANVSAVKRRYLTTIGLIQAPTGMEDDVSAKEVWAYDPNNPKDPAAIVNPPWRHDAKTNPTVKPAYALRDIWDRVHGLQEGQAAARLRDEAILRAVTGATGEQLLTEIRAVGARLDDLTELLRRVESGELTAEQVLARLRDLLPGGASQS
ncbi:hypothetical protein [Micromonospora sp. NPDC049891]|uniref:hypothetical protein n=1 Tax=Micromonospora sp. NPDC049891 TaxID=3155655 RepID=UPI0033ECC9AB